MVVLGDGNRACGDPLALELITHGLGDRIRILGRIRGDLDGIVGEEAFFNWKVREDDGDAVGFGLLDDRFGNGEAAEPHGNTLDVRAGDGLVGEGDQGVKGILVGGGEFTVQSLCLAAGEEALLRVLVHGMPSRALHPDELALHLCPCCCRRCCRSLNCRSLSCRSLGGRCLTAACRQHGHQGDHKHDLEQEQQFPRHVNLLGNVAEI